MPTPRTECKEISETVTTCWTQVPPVRDWIDVASAVTGITCTVLLGLLVVALVVRIVANAMRGRKS